MRVTIDQVMQLDTGELVDTNHHGFACFPSGAVMVNEITGQRIQPLRGRQDVVIPS